MNHETGLWPPVCPLGDLPYPVRQPYPDGQTLRCRPGNTTRLSLDGETIEIAQPGANIFRAAAAFQRDLFVIKPLSRSARAGTYEACQRRRMIGKISFESNTLRGNSQVANKAICL